MSKFEPNKLSSYDDESIIEEIKRVYIRFFNNRRMLKKDFELHARVGTSTVIRRFGNWENALQKAEIPSFPKAKILKIPLSEIKSDLERVKELNHNKYFTYVFYKNNGGKYGDTISSRFGHNRWEELLNKELGLYKERRILVVKEKRKSVSEEQLFNEIKSVWEKFGRRPTYGEFKKNSSIGVKIYEKRFGTWTDAIQQFCLKNSGYVSSHVGMMFKASKELLIQELQRIKKVHLLDILEYKDYRKHGGNYTKGTFLKYFGSWKNALQFVGLKPGGEWNKSPDNEQLFDELQKVWEHLGRQPLYTEMKNLSKYSYGVYERKFGGWKKAIYAFIADREKEEEISSNTLEIENNTTIDNVVEVINSEKSNRVETIIMKTPRIAGTKLRFTVFMRDNFTCKYCGRTTKEDGVKLEVDHVKAYSKGGETVLENLITACWDCNSGKSDKEL